MCIFWVTVNVRQTFCLKINTNNSNIDRFFLSRCTEVFLIMTRCAWTKRVTRTQDGDRKEGSPCSLPRRRQWTSLHPCCTGSCFSQGHQPPTRTCCRTSRLCLFSAKRPQGCEAGVWETLLLRWELRCYSAAYWINISVLGSSDDARLEKCWNAHDESSLALSESASTSVWCVCVLILLCFSVRAVSSAPFRWCNNLCRLMC